MFRVLETTVSAPVATGGTITFSYPTGLNAGFFTGARGHKLNVRGLQTIFNVPDSATIAFGASVVVTYNGVTTIPAGSVVQLHSELPGVADRVPASVATQNRTAFAPIHMVDFGAVAAAAANSVSLSQSVGAAAFFILNGALGVGGVATFDQPRNVVAAWTTTSILTIKGTDEYGVAMTEVSASGVAHTGKKAFKTITSIQSTASITAATVGTGDVLGLPFFVGQGGHRLVSLEDGVAATAGTVVGGDIAKATGLTGDVRGTWDPNGVPNGTIQFRLLIAATDALDRGNTQFS